jgi:hypothetical protein
MAHYGVKPVVMSTAKAEHGIRKIKLKKRKAPFQNGSRFSVVIRLADKRTST